MKLIEIDPESNKDIEVLYSFLASREYSISHNEMPTFEKHRMFVQKNPYRKWFFIQNNSKMIGSIYVLKDNGIGVPKSLIPQLFGTVLAGTKYGVQQARGRFGLGSKMVLLYAMSTLDLPIQITTRHEKDNLTHRVKLFIDLEKNQPIIHSEEQFEPGSNEYYENTGTEIKVSFTGSWNMAKLYVKEYFNILHLF